MAALPARILSPALLEGNDFRSAALLDHFGRNRGAGHRRRTQRHGIAADEEHLLELYRFAPLGLDLVDLKHILGGNPVLLPAGLDDCEHRFLALDFRVLGATA